MIRKNTIGQIGESIASDYLKEKGYKILTHNYRKPWGELDVVAKAKDGTLVFVEVKTLIAGGPESLQPEDNLSQSKLKKLRRICETFVGDNPKFINEKRGWRMDLLVVNINNSVEPDLEGNYDVRHYENI
jgi:putative endonuclease